MADNDPGVLFGFGFNCKQLGPEICRRPFNVIFFGSQKESDINIVCEITANEGFEDKSKSYTR